MIRLLASARVRTSQPNSVDFVNDREISIVFDARQIVASIMLSKSWSAIIEYRKGSLWLKATRYMSLIN